MADSQLTDLERDLAGRQIPTRVVESAVLAVINVVTLVGNSLVCLAVYRRQTLRTVANTFIVGLAVAGLVMAVAVMPLSLTAQILGRWPFGEHLCRAQGFTLYLFVFQALQLVMLIAVNRNIHVSRPSLHKRICTRKNALLAILCTVLLSGVTIGLWTSTQSATFKFHPGKIFCSFVVPDLTTSRRSTLLFAVLFVALPAFITAICYVMILVKIRRHADQYEACRGEHDSPAILTREGRKVTRIVLVIISGFLFCWIPCVIIDVIDTGVQRYLPREVYLTYTCLGFSSAMISPWIYGGMDRQVRKEMCSLFIFRPANSGSNTHRSVNATLKMQTL